MDVPLPGNFHLVPDFRLFAGDSLYLVKPLQRRFWLRSAAIADADAVAVDLHDAGRLADVAEPPDNFDLFRNAPGTQPPYIDHSSHLPLGIPQAH